MELEEAQKKVAEFMEVCGCKCVCTCVGVGVGMGMGVGVSAGAGVGVGMGVGACIRFWPTLRMCTCGYPV